MERLLFELLEAVIAYTDIKDKKNPLIKHWDKSEDFAYQRIKQVLSDITEYLKKED